MTHNKIIPALTREQEDEICFIIGTWYMMWKYTMGAHKEGCKGCDCQQYQLGYAKEQLKSMICKPIDE